ncbi:molybdopterin synthase catalytic subunit MoaE [Aeromonas salmonicida]|uniref:molybdopterin synthase catalytic subunit MoaE n=1 Tax=Aeromonas salmonicida TaxID=645 RepID=UPI00073CD5DE|nr:molybdopterin synthase catalytic subunit MoaE [Aeromonas salmonicida]KTA79079.1 molybdenum cofactor biosynthesis protein MoaE [Aeromonas salmonicida]MDE7529284.1 molybdopterin synthase catalytic subunit MoaE [Aeromonas salmonicida]MDE7533576.1 molybdopterin synthase catalytic subunit MoaE [Aeromonas salmonicida]
MSDVAITDRIVVQREDFSLADEYARLATRADSGAIVTFVGKVRDFNQGEEVKGLALEHYPGMTEKALADIVQEARRRWPLQECTLIHRIGELWLGDQIVLVAVSSAHRDAAFDACHFIMDFLKTRAPFWKKELTTEGVQRWVEAKESDNAAAAHWKI